MREHLTTQVVQTLPSPDQQVQDPVWVEKPLPAGTAGREAELFAEKNDKVRAHC